MDYRLLDAFRATFEGTRYLHRRSTLGDFVAMHLYEDLYALGRSSAFRRRVDGRQSVLNVRNRARGIEARRGDGTLGEIIPGVTAVVYSGFQVARGPVATVEIGVEVKILAKAMLKQIDRVITDLRNQVTQFRRAGREAICVGVVGINCASVTTAYDGDRVFTTDGKAHRHPHQEAAAAEARLMDEAKDTFDEFLILRYRATNAPPYPFEWVDRQATELDYGAVLARIGRAYDQRFGTA